jgi:hypothetical protein
MRYETLPGMTCCEMHRAAHMKLVAEMKTWFHLVPRTQRNVLRFYESLKQRGLTAEAIKAGLSDTCPCRTKCKSGRMTNEIHMPGQSRS